MCKLEVVEGDLEMGQMQRRLQTLLELAIAVGQREGLFQRRDTFPMKEMRLESKQ